MESNCRDAREHLLALVGSFVGPAAERVLGAADGDRGADRDVVVAFLGLRAFCRGERGPEARLGSAVFELLCGPPGYEPSDGGRYHEIQEGFSAARPEEVAPEPDEIAGLVRRVRFELSHSPHTRAFGVVSRTLLGRREAA